MTCRTVQANDVTWQFCPVDPPVEAARLQLVVGARVVDDIQLGAPPVSVAVSSTRPDFVGRSVPDGLVGVIGRPYPALPPAQVAGTVVGMTLAAPGYDALALAGPLGPQLGYPAAFVSLDLGTWRMVRQAVAIHGRVTRVVGGVAQRVAGAAIAVTAAVTVPALAGAQPPPPAAASFLALAAVTDAAGQFRLGPVARAVRLTLTASDGGGTVSGDVDLDYAEPINLIDFVLP